MSFSSRRRNYLLTPHRRDGLIEWMKSMLMHSFVLNALDSTGADTFSHFEMLIDEHREMTLALASSSSTSDEQQQADQLSSIAGGGGGGSNKPSRLKQIVPTVGTFHTRLPLRRAFEAYNAKYAVTARRHVCISFNEIRHVLNLAQIMALAGYGASRGLSPKTTSSGETIGRKERTSSGGGEAAEDAGLRDDGDDDSEGEDGRCRVKKQWGTGQDSPSHFLTYKEALTPPPLSLDGDGTAEGTEANNTASAPSARLEFRGPSLMTFDGDQTLYSDGTNFESNPKLANYLYLLLINGATVAVVTAAGYEYQTEKYELRLSGLLAFFEERKLEPEHCERFYLFGGECNYLLRLGRDYHLHPVRERGPGGWHTCTAHIPDSPANWDDESVKHLLDIAEASVRNSSTEQRLRSRVIRKRRAIGLIPRSTDERIPREGLDETVLRVQDELQNSTSTNVALPYCAFNGGRDVWVDVGNKRVGVQVLQSYLGIPTDKTLHIGDQFLNTGNDYAARDVCPCVWITSPEETTYILKSILRLAGVSLALPQNADSLNLTDSSAAGFAAAAADVAAAVAKARGVGSEGGKKVDFDEMERRTSRVQLMDVYTGEMLRAAPAPTPQQPATPKQVPSPTPSPRPT